MNAAVLTVSDRVSRGAAEDTSGDELVRSLLADGYEVDRRVVPDEAVEIATAIAELAAGASVVLTTGGTGVAPAASAAIAAAISTASSGTTRRSTS